MVGQVRNSSVYYVLGVLFVISAAMLGLTGCERQTSDWSGEDMASMVNHERAENALSVRSLYPAVMIDDVSEMVSKPVRERFTEIVAGALIRFHAAAGPVGDRQELLERVRDVSFALSLVSDAQGAALLQEGVTREFVAKLVADAEISSRGHDGLRASTVRLIERLGPYDVVWADMGGKKAPDVGVVRSAIMSNIRFGDLVSVLEDPALFDDFPPSEREEVLRALGKHQVSRIEAQAAVGDVLAFDRSVAVLRPAILLFWSRLRASPEVERLISSKMIELSDSRFEAFQSIEVIWRRQTQMAIDGVAFLLTYKSFGALGDLLKNAEMLSMIEVSRNATNLSLRADLFGSLGSGHLSMPSSSVSPHRFFARSYDQLWAVREAGGVIDPVSFVEAAFRVMFYTPAALNESSYVDGGSPLLRRAEAVFEEFSDRAGITLPMFYVYGSAAVVEKYFGTLGKYSDLMDRAVAVIERGLEAEISSFEREQLEFFLGAALMEYSNGLDQYNSGFVMIRRAVDLFDGIESPRVRSLLSSILSEVAISEAYASLSSGVGDEAVRVAFQRAIDLKSANPTTEVAELYDELAFLYAAWSKFERDGGRINRSQEVARSGISALEPGLLSNPTAHRFLGPQSLLLFLSGDEADGVRLGRAVVSGSSYRFSKFVEMWSDLQGDEIVVSDSLVSGIVDERLRILRGEVVLVAEGDLPN